ncbi:VOC family protein [Curtobacterium sp. RRHDQ10]|uniref:VOC family protein n=1 Tax=Curtobacterium phyllosphaerae TaxID=3413379 RepID=UPI003BF3A459
MQRIVPFLWYDHQAEDAARLYTGLFPDSSIDTVTKMADDRTVVVEFTLLGQPFRAMNGGPGHPHSDAVSFQVDVDDQAELDRVWDTLVADGGRGVGCGWLVDRWGLSWQVVPTRLGELMADPDPERAGRAMAAMMEMVKLDVAALEAAADGR